MEMAAVVEFWVHFEGRICCWTVACKREESRMTLSFWPWAEKRSVCLKPSVLCYQDLLEQLSKLTERMCLGQPRFIESFLWVWCWTIVSLVPYISLR